MSTFTRTETVTQCDFCNVKDSSAVPLGWFQVTSVFVEMRRVPEADPGEILFWHACRECGGKLHHWLQFLGIDYTFIPPTDYFSKGGHQFGSILVGVK